jgi:ubiquinone/menaquinone biosynthesis C-methylase UbiE
VRRSFDNLARSYEWLERLLFGRALEQARFVHLESLGDAQSVLILGEGDGRFLQRLSSLAPTCTIDVVDKSGAMIERAKRRTKSQQQVRFHQLDAREFRPARRYDAIVTCFFLDCFEAPVVDAIVEQLGAALSPGGHWLYTDFLENQGRLKNRAWLWTLYSAFGLVTDIESQTLADPRTAFTRVGLELMSVQRFASELLVSELWRKSEAGAPKLD